ncbi:MAG: hypothetical protein LC732_07130 [Acidobacteria bacterium]|nr:hypothetical protein [Acidobacteriota bacterium]
MMPRPRILLSLLVLLVVPLFAQSVVSEFPVSERDLAPMLGDAFDAQVVATDSGFLVFWKTAGVAQVARLSPEGTVERRAAVPELASNFGWYEAASNGETALLSGVCANDGKPLCVARFSSAGDFLGLISIPAVSHPISPVIASNGDDFVVTLSTNATREVVAVRIASDGTVGSPMILGPWDPNTHWTSATAIGSQYFVGFGTTGEHRLVRLSQSGIDASIVLDPPLSFWHQLRVEASDDRLVVAIPGVDSATFAIFDAQLAQRHPWTTISEAGGYPKLAPTAHGWLLATRDGSGAIIHPIGRDGRVGSPSREGEAFDLYDLAGRSDRALLVWTKRFELRTSVRAALLDDGAGILKSATTLSVGPAPQIHPVAAEGNGVVLAAWSELGSDGLFTIRARAFRDGIPLAPPVTMPSSGESQFMPAASFNGDSFLVVWSETSVYGARVALSGRLLDDTPISLFGSGSGGIVNRRTADVAWSGTAWIVVSSDQRGLIVARRVSPGGVVLDYGSAEITRPSPWGSAGHSAPTGPRGVDGSVRGDP